MSESQSAFNLFGLRLPVRATLAIVISTSLLLVDHYYEFFATILPTLSEPDRLRHAAYDHVILYFLIPLLVIMLVFRQNPAEYGFRLGDWRAGIRVTLIIWACAAPILTAARLLSPDVGAFYQPYVKDWGDVALTGVIELFGWEFFFRGFLLWSLYEVAGPAAVVLQAVPFAMAHVGKPAFETLSTIFGGTMFGWVAWRTRSFLFPFLVHLFIYTFIIVVSVAVR